MPRATRGAQIELACLRVIWVIWGTMKEPRINLRTPEDLIPVVDRVAARDFGGNKSQMVIAYLRERFEADGEMEAAETVMDLVDLMKVALESGVSDGEVAEFFSKKIEEQNEKEVSAA